MGLTDQDRQHLTEAYQRAKERHERRNDLLMDLEEHGSFETFCDAVYFKGPQLSLLSSEDLRIIADELDRRNKC